MKKTILILSLIAVLCGTLAYSVVHSHFPTASTCNGPNC